MHPAETHTHTCSTTGPSPRLDQTLQSLHSHSRKARRGIVADIMSCSLFSLAECMLVTNRVRQREAKQGIQVHLT